MFSHSVPLLWCSYEHVGKKLCQPDCASINNDNTQSHLLKGRFEVRYLVCMLSFPASTKKQWKSEVNCDLAARPERILICQRRAEGLLCFCCTEPSFPPSTFWKQGALFLPQATIWLQCWRFWLLKPIQPPTPCIQHTQSHTCAPPLPFASRSTFLKLASHEASG